MEDNRRKKNKKARLLVAEDESFVLETLVNFLELNGFDVIAARDGGEALKKFEDEGGDVDLLFLDVTMPELNGFEVYESIKNRFGPRPVIFSSGYSLEHTFAKAPHDAPKNFIQKPFPLDELLVFIKELIFEKGKGMAPRIG